MSDDRSSETVVTILPFYQGKILMQLRDDKPGVTHRGKWGLFGGTVDRGESYLEAASRELEEELGINNIELHKIDEQRVADLENIYAVAFTFKLVSNDAFIQYEGQDSLFVTRTDLTSGKLTSVKLVAEFPIVKTYYLPQMVDLALRFHGA